MSTYRHCQKRTSSADCMDWPKDRTFSILKCFPASLSPQLFNSQFSQTRSNLGCSVIWVAGKGRKKGASVGSLCCNMMWEHSFVWEWERGLQPFSWICPMSWCLPSDTQEHTLSRFQAFRGFICRDLHWHPDWKFLLQNNLICFRIYFRVTYSYSKVRISIQGA